VSGRAHIIGAGLSGLSAAVRLAHKGIPVTVHEAAGHAGGRCRSYFDRELDCVIDNGNHLVLNGNYATLDFLRLIGAEDTVHVPSPAHIPFVDLVDGTRWSVRPGKGRIPWFALSSLRRIPGTSLKDYLQSWRMMWATDTQAIKDVMPTGGVLWRRFWAPVIVAVTNTDPAAAGAATMRQVVVETLARGEAACRPVFFPNGLSRSLISPAVDFVTAMGGQVRFNHRLRGVQKINDTVSALEFVQDRVDLSDNDCVISAVPAAIAEDMFDGIVGPNAFSPIVNGHFRLKQAFDAPSLLGVVGGTAEWLFSRDDVVSVTVSAAASLVDLPSETIAVRFWADIQAAYGLVGVAMPPFRIVKEKRATFLQTPDQLRRRPDRRTRWRNLYLAGDWTATGLPATIEGSIRSGAAAASAALDQVNKMSGST